MVDQPGRDALTFLMGQYPAQIPRDRLYCWNHMWCRSLGEPGQFRFGFTSYAVRLLQDVYFLDWYSEPGDEWSERQEIGAIESSKAESLLYAPVSGKVLRFNERLLDDPSWINVDNYGAGWLFDLACESKGLMDAEGYVKYLEEAWPKAQRLIKGQLG